jgi:DNA-binding response OmpR family regulator
MAAKILVVDDDTNVQRLLQYTLKQEGYDVVIAGDGAEGFRLWGTEAPDLILLDVQLPKLDGYQVASKIRSEESGSGHVPIIMLTAEREVEQKVRGLRAGADDYLIKPFHPAELLARIKSLLARFAPKDLLIARPPMGRVPWGRRPSRSMPRSRCIASSAERSRSSMRTCSSAITACSSTSASTRRASWMS